MTSRIVGMMKSDVVPEEDPAQAVMAKAVMEQSLTAGHDQMSAHGGQSKQRKLRQDHRVNSSIIAASPSGRTLTEPHQTW